MLLYGSGLSSTVYAALRSLPEKAHFLPLVKGANAVGAARLGLEARPVRGDALYVLLGDDLLNGEPLPQSEFTVVQAAFADVRETRGAHGRMPGARSPRATRRTGLERICHAKQSNCRE